MKLKGSWIFFLTSNVCLVLEICSLAEGEGGGSHREVHICPLTGAEGDLQEM